MSVDVAIASAGKASADADLRQGVEKPRFGAHPASTPGAAASSLPGASAKAGAARVGGATNSGSATDEKARRALWLARSVGACPAIRFGALSMPCRLTEGMTLARSVDGSSENKQPPMLVWPVATRLTDSILALVERARGSHIVRTTVPEGHIPQYPDVDELLAIPVGSSREDVVVLAVSDLDDAARELLIKRISASFVGTRRGSVPVEMTAATPRSVNADATVTCAAAARTALDKAALDTLQRHGSSDLVALAIADTAATVFDCRRVTIGVGRRRLGKLLAVSGESRPDERRAIPRLLRGVVCEALQTGGACWPALSQEEAGARQPAHQRLYAEEGSLPLMSLVSDRVPGGPLVVVLERPSSRPFLPDEADALRAALAPALALTSRLRAQDRGVMQRTWRALQPDAWLPGVASRALRGLCLSLAVMALALAAFVPLPYQVGARVVVEASDRQVLVAPEAGHIQTAHVRAGDRVVAGELLATLDDRDLQLARDRWRSEMIKNQAAQSQALASRDRVELGRLRADATRIETEQNLVESRLARREIRAPFQGLVLSGDPTRSLGAPVAAGDVLFEIGAGERALSVEIDERDIDLIKPGAVADVRMAAAPRVVRASRLEQIVPVAVDRDGVQVFRIPALITDEGAVPSPGMQGVARIDAGTRTMLDSWTRPLRERAVLLAWRLGIIR